jgi:hypothetical protein
MAAICSSRQIAAHPSSVALLLAVPAAVDLWPQAKQVAADVDIPSATASRRVTMAARLPDGQPLFLTLEVGRPERSGDGFLAGFSFAGARVPHTFGEIVVKPAIGGSQVSVTLHWKGGIDRLVRTDLEAQADGFLAALVEAAERRSLAA